MAAMERVTASNSVAHRCLFNSFWKKDCVLWRGGVNCQALATLTLVNGLSLLMDLIFSRGFLTIRTAQCNVASLTLRTDGSLRDC